MRWGQGQDPGGSASSRLFLSRPFLHSQLLSLPWGDQGGPPGLWERASPPPHSGPRVPVLSMPCCPGSSRMKQALTHKCPLQASESSFSKPLPWNLFCGPQLSVSRREARGSGEGAALERHFPGNSSQVQLAHTWIRFELHILCQGK